jgi:hypothetical protein
VTRYANAAAVKQAVEETPALHIDSTARQTQSGCRRHGSGGQSNSERQGLHRGVPSNVGPRVGARSRITWRRTSMIDSNPANDDQFKTGQREVTEPKSSTSLRVRKASCGVGSGSFWNRIEDAAMMEESVEHGGNGGGVAGHADDNAAGGDQNFARRAAFKEAGKACGPCLSSMNRPTWLPVGSKSASVVTARVPTPYHRPPDRYEPRPRRVPRQKQLLEERSGGVQGPGSGVSVSLTAQPAANIPTKNTIIFMFASIAEISEQLVTMPDVLQS